MATAYSRETMNLPPLGPCRDPQRVAVFSGATVMGASGVICQTIVVDGGHTIH